MSWFYRHVLRPVLFTQNAEDIHNRTMRAPNFCLFASLVCAKVCP